MPVSLLKRTIVISLKIWQDGNWRLHPAWCDSAERYSGGDVPVHSTPRPGCLGQPTRFWPRKVSKTCSNGGCSLKWRYYCRFSSDQGSSEAQQSFVPFGVGNRMCIGFRLSVMEIKVILVHTLREYRVMKCDQTPVSRNSHVSRICQLLAQVWPVLSESTQSGLF